MSRRPTSGTPERMKSYLDPDNEEQRRKPGRISTIRLRTRLAWAAVLLGLGVVALTVLTRTMSVPGALHSGHARFEKTCETCHGEPNRWPTLNRPAFTLDRLNERCVECHDRYRPDSGHTTEAHIRFYDPSNTRVEAWKNRFQCIDCHTEHAGRDSAITLAPERLCIVCHAQVTPPIRSFGGDHPEFAVLLDQAKLYPDADRLAKDDAAPLETNLDAVAQAPIPVLAESRPPAPGLRFNHARHLDEYLAKHPRYRTDTADQRCLRCHAFDPQGQDLRPTRFEGGCDAAGCHATEAGLLKAEVSDQIPIDLRSLSDDPAVAASAAEAPDAGQPVPLLARLKYIDAAGVAPEGLASARRDFVETEDVVEAQGFFTKRIRHRDPWVLLAVDVLGREVEELARARGPLAGRRLRTRMAERRASALDDPCSEEAAEILPNAGQKLALCESVESLGEQITAIDERLRQLQAPAAAAEPIEIGGPALVQLGEMLRSLSLGEPHRPRLDLAATRLAAAIEGKGLTLSPIVDPRREDRARDELRRQLGVLANVQAEWVQREVRTLQYKLDQLDEPPPIAGASGEARADLEARRRSLDAERAQLRGAVARLGDLGRDCEVLFLRLALLAVPEDAPPLAEEDRDDWVREQIALRESALRTVAKPCLQCHQLGRTPQGRIEFAPLRVQDRQLPDSLFVHGPHLRFQSGDFPDADPRGGTCGSCHASILKSNQAEPVHFTGVQSCRSCHNPRDVSERCQTCHAFHPAPRRAAELSNEFKLCSTTEAPAP